MNHIRGIWRYLASTKNEVLTFDGKGISTHMTIASDASFCPGGDRSRTGIVILWMGMVVHWMCKKQTLATLSSCEAELSASIHGLKMGLGIRAVAEELIGRVRIELHGDNMAMIQTILHEVTSWRSRHYAVRAAWARDTIKDQKIELKHVPGTEIVADPLTKILAGPELPKARKKLGMIDVSDVRPDESNVIAQCVGNLRKPPNVDSAEGAQGGEECCNAHVLIYESLD